jgi:CHAT domain-containing protein
MGPIHRKLQELGVSAGAEVAVLTDYGSLLPLHAASRQEGDQLRVFLDDYAVSYAPSAYLLGVAARRRRRLELDDGMAELCAVIDPTASLRFASVEADALVAVFPSERRRILAGREATRDAVLRELPQARYAHIASHGFYDWFYPEKSTLTLADGQLSEADVSSILRLHAARLVVLSACETGVSDVREQPDEHIGFSTAFFRAGAAGVLSSVWAVADISTALLLGRFYHHHIVDGLSPAAALRAAQYWIRTSTAAQLGLADHWKRVYEHSGGQDVDAFQKLRYHQAQPGARPFEDPYFWAGYNFVGA